MENAIKYAALEDAITALENAIDEIKSLGKQYADDVTTIDGIRLDLQAELEELGPVIDAEYEREQAALEREYWQSR